MNKRGAFSVLAAMVVFAALTVMTLTGLADPFNASAAARVQGLESPPLTAFFKVITNMGDWFVYLPILALLLLAPKTRRAAGRPVAAALAASAALNGLLKAIFAVPRPDAHRLIPITGFSYPSGHAMNGAAFVCACLLPLLRSDVRQGLKLAAVAAAVSFALLVGFSRVYLGVHNPTDVIAGYAAGFCAACIVTEITDRKRGVGR